MAGSTLNSSMVRIRCGPWRIWNVSISRKQLLLQRANAAAAMNRSDLPDHIRAAYKKARDSADMALGMQDAKARAQAKLLGGDPSQPTEPPPQQQIMPQQPTPPSEPQAENALQGQPNSLPTPL